MRVNQFRILCPVGYARLVALYRLDPVTAERCCQWLAYNTTALADVPSRLADGAVIEWSFVGAYAGSPVARVEFKLPPDWRAIAERASVEDLLAVAPIPAAGAIRAPTWAELHPNQAAP